MHRFFSIIVFFPVILMMVLWLSLIKYVQLATNEMQEIMIIDAANSASDSAMELAQTISEIDMYGTISISPKEVWTEYKRAFLTSMNILSDRNMERFEAYCPATILAVNDGYFVRMRTLVCMANTNHSAASDCVSACGSRQPMFIWSQKIPYARRWNSSNGGQYVIADTMNGANIYGYNIGSPRAEIWGSQVPEVSSAGGVHDVSLIAYELVRTMDYLISLENEQVSTGAFVENAFYLPKSLVDTLYYDAVTFKGMSLLNLIQGFDMLGNSPVDYYTISNTQIVPATQIALYTNGSQRVYSPYSPGVNTIAPQNVSGCLDIVSSVYIAARRGFYPDIRWYQMN